jgi:rubrerythrin
MMQNGFKTFAEVIGFAMMREEESHEFYRDLAGKTKDLFMKEIFKEFAQEELNHLKTLKDLDVRGLERIYENIVGNIDELNVSGTLKDVSATPEMDFKELLVAAMKREEISQRLYSFLAETSDDNDLSLLFVGLAKEEAKHKLRIEKTYNQLYGE